MYCKNFSELSKQDAGIAGGKGASLGEMTRAGIPVPPGFVVLADAFEKFLEETDLNVEIDSILHGVDTKAMHTIEHASERIQKLILEAKMPEDIASVIEKDFAILDTEFVAVRSSATAEDSASAAWAGQLDSFLNTTEETLLQNVQKCWASLFTPRAIFYRFEQGLHESKISVAVVVQKMVESEVSGIAFSVHPVTEDRNQLIIEAGYGLGEAIVSGQITPDSYVVEKIPLRIIDTNISEQERGIFRREIGGMGEMGANEWQNISQEKRNLQKLSNDQILELSEIIIGIEKHHGFPCDIEWAVGPEFVEGQRKMKFYIVQSRPITTLAPQNISQYASFSYEDYQYAGYYKSSLFALWFWTTWYQKDLAEKIHFPLHVPEYIALQGGHSFLKRVNVESIHHFLSDKVKENDIAFFDHIVSCADEEFQSALRYEDSLPSSKNEAESFAEAVECARRIMFFWSLGWQFSESFDATLKAEAMKAGIAEGDIALYIASPATPLMRQQKEARKLRTLLESQDLGEDVMSNREKVIEHIEKSSQLREVFEKHIREYEWIETINWVGEKLTLPKLLEQMAGLKGDEKETAIQVPDNFITCSKIAERIAYIRQAGAEYSSILENRLTPFLFSLANKMAVPHRDMLSLAPHEFFQGTEIAKNVSEIIQKRRDENWVMFIENNALELIDEKVTVDTFSASLLPKYSDDGGDIIRGNIGNKGKATGPVRVILATDDFHKMQSGDVLVTPMTTPDFVLLMQKSSAIVTDMGGLLCHAAIVSRELNKPCVIGTNFGTQVLKDGDLVEVDADNGVVRILERAGNDQQEKPNKSDIAMIPDREWFKFIERSEHFFVYTLFAQTDSYLLHAVTGFAFPESLYRYQNGLGANYRDREIYQKANEYFFSLMESADPRILKCAEEGVRMNKHADQLLAEYKDVQALEKLQPSDFRECLDTALDTLLYGCTIPYLFLEAADYAKSIGKWDERHEQHIRALEPLRAVSKYFEFEELVLSRFFEFAAEKLQLNDHALARFLTPREIEQVFSGTNSLSEQELKQRSEWCIFWTQDGGQNFTFSYDRDGAKKYAFLIDLVIRSKDEFLGTIGFKGYVRGKVRIVNTKAEMKNFEDGEVLVSQSTNPTLMPVIAKCSAIITDEGGMASHASIISRELKKPCIIGTKIATQVLHDGDLVEVDADNGVVRILERGEEEEIPVYEKIFSRDFCLPLVEAWCRAESTDARVWTAKQQPKVPYIIFEKKGDVVNCYMDNSGIDWIKHELSELVSKNPGYVQFASDRFVEAVKPMACCWEKDEISDLDELKMYLKSLRAAWVWFEAVWWLMELFHDNEEQIKRLMPARLATEKIGDGSDTLIKDSLRVIFPHLDDVADYLLMEEIESENIPSHSELEKRKNGYIYTNARLFVGGSIRDIESEFGISVNEGSLESLREKHHVNGKSAYGGSVRGKVHIILSKKQIPLVKESEVLVAAMTTPDYLPAMQKAIAFITDEGGITCHAAIVARELKKPCIIGTKIATQVLKDGDLVEVDADHGVVTILERKRLI